MNQLIKIGLGLAIAIIFPLMVGLGVEAFYPSPKASYERCTPIIQPAPLLATGSSVTTDDTAYQNCLDAGENTTNTYNRNVFAIVVVIGFVAIALGMLTLTENLGPVAPGLVFGGLFTIIYGTQRGFSAVDKRFLFVELLVLLLGLIWVTRRYLKVVEKK